MRIKIDENLQEYPANIKIVGIGGAGGNAINRMIEADIKGVELIAVNTDAQVLRRSLAHNKLQIGQQLTKGLGAGGKPEIGKKAAEEDREKIQAELSNADMVFVTAGMGGGTGTGAAPVIAEISRSLNALTIGVVSFPFEFEGKTRIQQAEIGIKELQPFVDTLLIIPNEKMFEIGSKEMQWIEGFRLADDVLQQAVQAITTVITSSGIVNIDFADVKNVMKDAGQALMGLGETEAGEDRAIKALEQAICSPLLDNVSIAGAKGIILNITTGKDFKMCELQDISRAIRERANCDHLFYGHVLKEDMEGRIKITVIATGFPAQKRPLIIPFAEKHKKIKEELGWDTIGNKSAAEAPSGDLSRPAYLRYKPRKLV